MKARSASASKEKRANGEGSVCTRILKSGKKRYIEPTDRKNSGYRTISPIQE